MEIRTAHHPRPPLSLPSKQSSHLLYHHPLPPHSASPTLPPQSSSSPPSTSGPSLPQISHQPPPRPSNLPPQQTEMLSRLRDHERSIRSEYETEKNRLNREVQQVIREFLETPAISASRRSRLPLFISRLLMKDEEDRAVDQSFQNALANHLNNMYREFQYVAGPPPLDRISSNVSPSGTRSTRLPSLTKPAQPPHHSPHYSQTSSRSPYPPPHQQPPSQQSQPPNLGPSGPRSNTLPPISSVPHAHHYGSPPSRPNVPHGPPQNHSPHDPYANGQMSDEYRHKRKSPSMIYDDYEAKRARTVNSAYKTISVERKITFDEVYQHGKAQYKHSIVQWPPAPHGKFYILKCDVHGVHFGKPKTALQGAAKHLAGVLHGHMPKHYDLAVEHLGFEVVDCTPELVAKHNACVEEAIEHGYVPRNDVIRPGLRKSGNRPQSPSAMDRQVLRPSPPPSQSPKDGASKRIKVEAITRPSPGELYRVFNKDTQTYSLGLMLYWGKQPDYGEPKLSGDLGTMGLLRGSPPDVPACYEVNLAIPEIVGWAPGYGNDGPLEEERVFPMALFDKTCHVDWVAASHLFPFNPDSVQINDPECGFLSTLNSALTCMAKGKGFLSYEAFQKHLRNPTEMQLSPDSDTERDRDRDRGQLPESSQSAPLK